MSRRQARQDAVCLMYEIDIQNGGSDDILERFFNTHALNEADAKYIDEIVKLALEHRDDIDKGIEQSCGRKTGYLAKMDLAILRIAAAEMLYMPSVPYVVSIDEAVELAKRYGDDMSPSFINGVLAGLIKQLTKA
ncbi:transcription antitermination factor NusB [Mahella sp.]|uniref:transcription antitermination factor NusB n=1 Tax=Mahella sp. TaxID=2798721 RepID=UPI0025B8D9B4|nr:transcription antitermination factor NusB [Mahella sp.]MBZ4666424.1 NusB antitermination factor [Mahella sp.]